MGSVANKAPSYAWYPRDFAADEPVQLMSIEEEGAYRRLLDHQWLHGSIPADIEQIARICKNTPLAKMRRWWKAIAPCFPPVEGDAARLQNRRMERDRAKAVAFRIEQSNKGRAGAVARWGLSRGDDPPDGECHSSGDSPGHSSSHSSGHQSATDRSMPGDGFAVCSLQFASARTTNNSTVTEAREALCAQLPADYHGDLDRLIARIGPTNGSSADDRRVSWLYNLSMALNPEHSPSYRPEVMGQAIRQLNANGELNWNRFEGYMRSVAAGQPVGSGSHQPSRTPRERDNSDGRALLVAGNLIDLIRANRNPQYPRSPVPGFFEALPEYQRRAINAVGGLDAILGDHDAKSERILAAQLAKVLRAAADTTGAAA